MTTIGQTSSPASSRRSGVPDRLRSRSLRILLLEDNPLDAELTTAILCGEELQCEIDRVDEEHSYVRALQSEKYDLILADYSLPAFDGMTALTIAREKVPEIPFIFVSGALGEELAIETLKRGATDYVLKHRPERLLPAVRRALRETEERAERKRAEERLRELAAENARLYREAESANRAKDEFLATLSHELRTPMTSILGWTRMMKLGDLSPEETQAALESIERSARVQAQLIDDLLDVSRIISGKLQLEFTTFDVAELVRSAVETVRMSAETKQISLTLSVADHPCPMRGDRNRLQQVLWNLLQNAIKFTPEGGTIEVSLEVVDTTAVLRVKDSGKGIAPEFLSRIFDRFQQAHASDTREHGGLGLGLAIAKHIVDEHSGMVEAFSEGPGKGSKFTVRLPVSQDCAAPEVTQKSNNAVSLAGHRILLVEDEPDTRELLTTILRRAGVEVLACGSVAEALQVLDDLVVDLVISDIAMPINDGYELVRQIRAHERAHSAPVIAVTAFGTEKDRDRVRLAGFVRHLVKPIEPAILIETIAEVLDRHHSATSEQAKGTLVGSSAPEALSSITHNK